MEKWIKIYKKHKRKNSIKISLIYATFFAITINCKSNLFALATLIAMLQLVTSNNQINARMLYQTCKVAI